MLLDDLTESILDHFSFLIFLIVFPSINGVGCPMSIQYNGTLGDFVWLPSGLVVDSSFWAPGYPTNPRIRNDFVLATKTGLKDGYAASQTITSECIRRPALRI